MTAQNADYVKHVEYGHAFIRPHPVDAAIPWVHSGRSPWELTTINGHPVKVVRRVVMIGPWEDAVRPADGMGI